MIFLILNRRDFEYDVYSLIKAFYTGSEIRVFDAWEDLPEDMRPGLVFDVCFQHDPVISGVVSVQDDREEAGLKTELESGLKLETETGSTPGSAPSEETISAGNKENKEENKEKNQEAGIRQVTLRVYEDKMLGEEPQNEEVLSEDTRHFMVPDKDSAETLFKGPARESTCLITPEMTRMQVKSAVKTLLYEALCEMNGRTLPWGDLTGIRPVKLAMGKIREGFSNAQTAAFLRDEYHVSNAKTALAVMIANREKALLDAMDYRNGYSLYVGIPFCPTICLYCSFSSSPLSLWKDQVDAYLDALEREMKGACDMFAPKQLQTVYIGGGTPTTLEPRQLDRLLTMIETYFDLSGVKEFTVEAGRPDSITKEKLEVIAGHGIGRLSINPQTMNQKTLDVIGRRHTVEQVREAFQMARDAGFANINMDLIVGLPGEGLTEVEHTMDEVGALAPESVTVHALALKRSSRLNEKLKEYEAVSFQASDEIMDLTMNRNRERGLYPYYLYRQKNMAGNFENVGYAAAGSECLYNILIMEEVQSILALGAGGSTKLVYEDGLIERIENVKDIKSYLERVDEMVERKRTGAVKYRYRG